MKGIRGLLEKDFRLFFRQGGNLFFVLAFVALFFTLTEKKTATFIAIYIPSVIAVYAEISEVFKSLYALMHHRLLNTSDISVRKALCYIVLG